MLKLLKLIVLVAILFIQFSNCFIQTSLNPYPGLHSRLAANNHDEIINPTDEILAQYKEEFEKLRGTPELVDKLESLVTQYPGIELNMNLYRMLYPFKLDEFQEQGLSSLIGGNNVLVTTPTGSGKTLVGELAIYFALMMGLRVAYTTPLKALSNQKFKDFRMRYGGDRVGLLTGDIALNRGAPITIMTTEVFRNMIYDDDSQRQLGNLFMVCFDEFHFMNDPDRGTVWEESVISCPSSVRILALSATMGNVADIKGWISSIHGPTELVFSEHRPVPLRYFFASKQGFYPLFRNPQAGPGATAGVVKESGKLDAGSSVNPAIVKLEQRFQKTSKITSRIKNSKANINQLIPKYSDIATELHKLNQLPAIIFIFSRAGCEQSAKMVMQMKTKLLSVEETKYVNEAIANFIRSNPDIPVDKGSVQMLRSGVGVHHAGLITVWKALIEDLFNANKIKILFATETLAAGVNMPARTTVISSVTKRINSEVIRLKTSQLLQMAGRAGRRGKDTEGSVVIMRNRFEDFSVGHKILTSSIDGIKSHFKTSYSLTVKLLETRTVEECKALIGKSFGAYMMTKRIQKRLKSENSDIVAYRDILQYFTLEGAREFFKLERRLEKETRNYEFLVSKLMDSENELVQAIADYMPMGIGIILRSSTGFNDNGECGFFLGDVKWGNDHRSRGLGVLTRDLKLLIVQKEHIRAFAEADSNILPKTAEVLLDLINLATSWDEMDNNPVGSSKPILQGNYDIEKIIAKQPELHNALLTVQKTSEFAVPPIPGSLIRQEQIVEQIKEEFDRHPVVLEGKQKEVVDALKYVVQLRDPVGFVNPRQGKSEEGDSATEVFAWRMFQSVYSVLQDFGALEGTNATELGQMVSSLSADNELWLSLVLRHESVQDLDASQLSAVMSAIVVDGYKASNAFFQNPPSQKTQEALNAIQPLYSELQKAQRKAKIDFPVNLCVESAGLVESWVGRNTNWRDLCKETSLDQGDVCRLLRRTSEVLRQLPNAYGVPPRVAQVAMDAAVLMERFPVADMTDDVIAMAGIDGAGIIPSSSSAGKGFDVIGGGIRPVGEVFEDLENLDSDEEDDDEAMLDKFLLDDDDGDEDSDFNPRQQDQSIEDLEEFLNNVLEGKQEKGLKTQIKNNLQNEEDEQSIEEKKMDKMLFDIFNEDK